jgi:phosphomannomutase
MKRFSYKILQKLQNGSDIRGVAMGGVPGEEVNLTKEVAAQLGRAFACWLEKNGTGTRKVAVGTDSRISGAALKEAFISGLLDEGFNVIDCGLASTPAMFMTTIHPDHGVEGGVMLTASHLPFNRNGMKFFTARGGFDKEDIRQLLLIAAEGRAEQKLKKGHREKVDFISEYSAFLVDTIRREVNDPVHYLTPLQGLKIIVDAGNGAGGFFAGKVLEPLGADTSGSQFLLPDGRFPNHIPNPEDEKAMASICHAVLREKADLGIIFDTDVDRSAIVDEAGNAINRNELIALISAVILEEHPGSVIVTDSITSSGLKWFIEDHLKGTHHRFKRGYKNVINESIRLNREGKESWLAMETSGHAALKENHFLDDGAYLVAKLLIQMAKLNRRNRSLADLITALPKSRESGEYRLTMGADDFPEYGSLILEKMEKMTDSQEGWIPETPNYEGLRIQCLNQDEAGWFLLRISLHDPELALNIESDVEGGVERIRSRLHGLLSRFNKLDISAITPAS